MSQLRRRLENFGDPAAGRESEAERRLKAAVAAARGEGHAAGYAEGFAAALAQIDAEERGIIRDLVEAIHDLELRQSAARMDAIAALRPVIEDIARIAAPQMAARGLADEIADAVAVQLDRGRGEILTINAAPARVESLRDRLGHGLRVEADPTLGPLAVRLEWAGGGAVFDAEGALKAALGVIETFHTLTPPERLKDAG